MSDCLTVKSEVIFSTINSLILQLEGSVPLGVGTGWDWLWAPEAALSDSAQQPQSLGQCLDLGEAGCLREVGAESTVWGFCWCCRLETRGGSGDDSERIRKLSWLWRLAICGRERTRNK